MLYSRIKIQTHRGTTYYLEHHLDSQGRRYLVTDPEGNRLAEILTPETPWPEWAEMMFGTLIRIREGV
jgi:hypothetical protein